MNTFIMLTNSIRSRDDFQIA